MAFEEFEIEAGGVGIEQQRRLRNTGRHLFQQLEPFADQRRLEEDEASEIAAGARHAFDVAEPNGIGGQVEYGRYRLRRLVHLARHRRAVADDDIGIRRNEARHDLTDPRHAAAGPVDFEFRCIAVDPAALLQAGDQRRITPDAFRIALPDTHQNSDTARLAGLLGARGDRPMARENSRRTKSCNEFAALHFLDFYFA